MHPYLYPTQTNNTLYPYIHTHPLVRQAYYSTVRYKRQLLICNRSTSLEALCSSARSRFLRACRSERRLRTAAAATGSEALRTAMRRRRFGTRVMSGSNSVTPSSSRSASPELLTSGERSRLRLRLHLSCQGHSPNYPMKLFYCTTGEVWVEHARFANAGIVFGTEIVVNYHSAIRGHCRSFRIALNVHIHDVSGWLQIWLRVHHFRVRFAE